MAFPGPYVYEESDMKGVLGLGYSSTDLYEAPLMRSSILVVSSLKPGFGER